MGLILEIRAGFRVAVLAFRVWDRLWVQELRAPADPSMETSLACHGLSPAATRLP